MPDRLDELQKRITAQLGKAKVGLPTKPLLRHLLEIAYWATLRTEEGSFIRGSLTYADPSNPEPDPPVTRRAGFPSFSPLSTRVPLTPEALVKLSRAIDQWAGSIAVFRAENDGIEAWGVVDQMVHLNVRMNREGSKGPAHPGTLTIVMEGIADLSIYHAGVFVGALRQDRIVTHQSDALRSRQVRNRVRLPLEPFAQQLAQVLSEETKGRMGEELFASWSHTVARLCIGTRRAGTGGAYILSTNPRANLLEIKYGFEYQRLNSALVLGVLDTVYNDQMEDAVRDADLLDHDMVTARDFAFADAEDRELEMSGAVRLVTSLASVDGVVVLSLPALVRGFGAKIVAAGAIGKVYDGRHYATKGAKAPKIDCTRFGTRHTSVLRYCKNDPAAIGIIVSQDGQVRLVTTAGRSLLMWEDVKLLEYSSDVQQYLANQRRGKRYRDAMRSRTRLGYSPMPKTLEELAVAAKKSKVAHK